VLHVSGRAPNLINLLCPPECNVAYLDEAGEAPEAIVLDLIDLGFLVDSQAYIAALESFDDDGDGAFDRFGFLQLVGDLQFIFDNWIDGVRNPTCIVLLGHSHGVVWAHLAAAVLPQVPIDFLVSLDGICTFWSFDHAPSITGYYATNGNPWPFDISDPCALWNIPGLAAPANTEDAVFDNVVHNLEAQAGIGLLQDTEPNHRLDGTTSNVRTFVSANEDHTGVHLGDGDAVAWVRARLAELATAP